MSLDLILSNNPLILKLFHQLHLNFYFTRPAIKHVAEFLIASSQTSFSGKVSNITSLSCSNKHRTSFGYFLSHGAWQASMLWKSLQKFVSQAICSLSENNDAPWFAIYDDTIVVKSKPSSRATQPTAAASFHFSHLEHKTVFGHQILTCMLSCAKLTLPFSLRLYQKTAEHISLSKIDMVCQIAEQLPFGVHHKAYALCDSWFTCKKVIDAHARRNYELIGALKSNRVIYPTQCALGISVGQFAKSITKSKANLVTVGKRSYWTYRYQGKLNDIKEAVVVVSWPEEAFGNEAAMRCFLCTDITLSAQTILSYYSGRWPIEVYFQQSKSKLAFGKYQVRSLESIEKYFVLNALAYIFFMMDDNGCVKFCDGHKSVQNQFEKQIYFWIYEQAQHNIPFSDILASLHVA